MDSIQSWYCFPMSILFSLFDKLFLFVSFFSFFHSQIDSKSHLHLDQCVTCYGLILLKILEMKNHRNILVTIQFEDVLIFISKEKYPSLIKFQLLEYASHRKPLFYLIYSFPPTAIQQYVNFCKTIICYRLLELMKLKMQGKNSVSLTQINTLCTNQTQ